MGNILTDTPAFGQSDNTLLLKIATMLGGEPRALQDTNNSLLLLIAQRLSTATQISNLPTTDPHVAGQLWLNSGAVMVSQG